MYFFNFIDFQIIGASPEILVRLRNNKITIRPIAGTRPRGRNKKQDKFFFVIFHVRKYHSKTKFARFSKNLNLVVFESSVCRVSEISH